MSDEFCSFGCRITSWTRDRDLVAFGSMLLTVASCHLIATVRALEGQRVYHTLGDDRLGIAARLAAENALLVLHRAHAMHAQKLVAAARLHRSIAKLEAYRTLEVVEKTRLAVVSHFCAF